MALLIEHGADVSESTASRKKLLYVSCQKVVALLIEGHDKVAALLIEHCANESRGTTDDETTLYVARKDGHEKAVTLPKKHDVLVNAIHPTLHMLPALMSCLGGRASALSTRHWSQPLQY